MIIGSLKADDAKTLALLHEKVFGENHFIANFSVSMIIKYIVFFQGITELVTM